MKYILHIHPKFSHLKPKIEQILSNFNSKGEAIVLGERNHIKAFELNDINLNVKSFKKPNIFNAFVYKFIRPSKAKRSFMYANKLINLGISTPFPVAYAEVYSTLGLKQSYYVSEHITYDFEFRELIHRPNFPNRNAILQQMAAFTFKLHENNINFLDHSPGNTFIVKTKNNYKFYLIDLNRMRFENMSLKKRMRNFRRLWLSKTMVKVMSKTYAELYGTSFETIYSLMQKYSKTFQSKINKKKLRRSGRRFNFKG